MLPGRAQVTASSVRHEHGASAPSEWRFVVDHDDAVKMPDVVVLVPFAGAMRRAAIGSYDTLFDKFGLTRAPSKTFTIRGPGPQ
jgi:hypothetical protein